MKVDRIHIIKERLTDGPWPVIQQQVAIGAPARMATPSALAGV